jgi:hypothetical protein
VPAGDTVQIAADWVVLNTLEADKLHVHVRASLQSWQSWLTKNVGHDDAAASRAAAARLIASYLADPTSVKLRPLPLIPPGSPI